jgi:hypothetical protein
MGLPLKEGRTSNAFWTLGVQMNEVQYENWWDTEGGFQAKEL